MEAREPYDMNKLAKAVLSDNADGLGHLLGEVSLSVEEYGKIAALTSALGKLECLKVLRAREFPDAGSWEAAAQRGHLHILHYLKEESGDAERECGCASECAAIAGHLHCLKFLQFLSPHWTVFTSEVAARAGQQDCLAYLAENGCRIGASTCAAAADSGQYKCLRYLHAVHRCPWDVATTRNAAYGGHLSCLRYAVEEGCDVGDGTFAGAVEGAQVECLEYLLSAGHCPAHPPRIRELESDRLLDCLRLLASCGVSDNPGTVVLAASLGYLKLVRQIHSFGDPLWRSATDQFDRAAFPPDIPWSLGAGFLGREDTVWDAGLLHVPPSDEHLSACWGTLRYGFLHGAPLTPRAEALVRERRACAQEVVRCFHTAWWWAKARGPHAGKWAAMLRLPPDVLMTIMELAQVEIFEALHRERRPRWGFMRPYAEKVGRLGNGKKL